jgi:hypothetical protein
MLLDVSRLHKQGGAMGRLSTDGSTVYTAWLTVPDKHGEQRAYSKVITVLKSQVGTVSLLY